ncbi:VirB8/TrbF family protein [Sphingomonas sp. CROZ-RG-20F-R02-07]|uniref:virB8 family protein n=1 Tax=Sphingomonas sp. CROZ-RG-20F-R02-07 TaxID=2914832 RepID=UPI001F5A3609|nr:VirB8/TrbF family protein [Sphingomonas sp. CROZ-RG-20F-R02-07]
MNEQSSTYFDVARSWADDRDAASARSRRIAWTIAGLACSIAALEAVSLAMLLPLKQVVPVAVMVDRTTGYVERVDLSQPKALTANEALQRALLAQYVVARESYDPVGIRAAYRKVALWSAGPARSGYIEAMNQHPPSAQLASVRREIALATTIRSVTMLSPSTAQVRFDVAHVGYDGRNTDIRPYVATIAFTFSGQPMKVEDRLENPLGFAVGSYKVDAEAPPPAPPRDQPVVPMAVPPMAVSQ